MYARSANPLHQIQAYKYYAKKDIYPSITELKTVYYPASNQFEAA